MRLSPSSDAKLSKILLQIKKYIPEALHNFIANKKYIIEYILKALHNIIANREYILAALYNTIANKKYFLEYILVYLQSFIANKKYTLEYIPEALQNIIANIFIMEIYWGFPGPDFYLTNHWSAKLWSAHLIVITDHQ